MGMKELSVFDIVGPNMIGPSSSHTAGALRIALLASHLVRGEIRRVTFRLYRSFAETHEGHGTDRALLGGILGFSADDPRIRDSLEIAQSRNIRYEFIPDQTVRDVHPNTVDIEIEDDTGRTTRVRGESVGGGAAVIRRINAVEVDFSGEYSTLVVEQLDEPGVLAWIAGCLALAGVNIAFTKLFREEKGKVAYTVIEADEPIPPETVRHIRDSKDVLDATLITL